MFKGHEIRKVCHEDEWWFSVIDVVGAISQSSNPRRYWSDLKRDLTEKEGYNELYEDIVQLPMQGKDGKLYQTDAATVETLFREAQWAADAERDERHEQLDREMGYWR